MARGNDLVWALWCALLEQMDKGGKPSPGRCANGCKNPKLPEHIFCNSCRIERGGYAFVKTK